MNGEEFNLVALCDTNILPGRNNKLNDFTSPLPHAMEFGERYSMCLSDITLPNVMYNINRDDNMMTLSFFQKYDKKPETDIVYMYKGAQSRLLYQVKFSVKSEQYSNFQDFGAKTSAYIMKMMNGLNEDNNLNWLHTEVLAVGLNNMVNTVTVLNNFFERYKRNVESVLNKNVKRVGNVLTAAKIWGPPMKAPVDYDYETNITYKKLHEYIMDAVNHDSLWTDDDELGLFHEDLLSEDAMKIWSRAHLETKLFSLRGIYDEKDNDNPSPEPDGWPNMTALRRKTIITIHGYMSKLYRMVADHAGVARNIKNILELSIRFYLCGPVLIDVMVEDGGFLWKDFDNTEPELDNDHEFWDEMVEFNGKCNDIINKTAYHPLDDLCLQSLKMLKTLTGNSFDLDNLKLQDMIRIMKGVYKRVRIFADDVGRMLEECKKIAGDNTDRFNYLQNKISSSNIHEYIYINRKVKIMPSVVADEVRKLFERMGYTDDGYLVINPYPPSAANDYATRSTYYSPLIELTHISLSGSELQTLFGVTNPSVYAPSAGVLFRSDRKPNFQHKTTNMYLYCDQIEEQYVNNTMVKLLAIIPLPWDTPYGHPIHHVVTTPHFLNLSSAHLTELRFTLRNRHGEEIRFEDTEQTVLVVVVLRPSRKGIL